MNIVNNTKKASKKTRKSGKGLKVGVVDFYLRFVLFLAIIGVVYIWNSHQAVKQVRVMEELKAVRKDLKNKYLMKQSTLHAVTRLSEISDKVDSLGLYRPTKIYRIYKDTPELVVSPKEKPIQIDTLHIKDTLTKDSLNLTQHIVSNSKP